MKDLPFKERTFVTILITEPDTPIYETGEEIIQKIKKFPEKLQALIKLLPKVRKMKINQIITINTYNPRYVGELGEATYTLQRLN